MEAIHRDWKKYVPMILLILMQCIIFTNSAEDYQKIMNKTYELSIGDYILDFYKGTLPYTMLGKDIPFNIPGIWSFYYIYFFAVLSKEISKIFQKPEYQFVIRYKTRSCWFHHQTGKFFSEVIKYLLITYVTYFLYAILKGVSALGVNREYQMEMNGLDLTGFRNQELIVLIIVVPCIVMLAFAFFQYTVSIRTNTIVGMLVSVVILVSSVFYMNPLLIGNYLMVMRYERLLLGGTSIGLGIVVCIVMSGVSLMAAKKAMEKRDLL